MLLACAGAAVSPRFLASLTTAIPDMAGVGSSAPRHSLGPTQRLGAPAPRAGAGGSGEVTPALPPSCTPATAPASLHRSHRVPPPQAAGCQGHGEPAEATAVRGKSHGKGEHSPLSDLRINKKSSLRISFWSPRSWKGKERQVGGCPSHRSPAGSRAQPRPKRLPGAAGPELAPWGWQRGSSRPWEAPWGGERSPSSEPSSWGQGGALG